MKKIVGILRPFDYQQQLFVYEDGNKIDSIQSTVDSLPTTIIELSQKYEIIQIDLTGPKQYSKGISQKIKSEECTKYSTNSLKINLI